MKAMKCDRCGVLYETYWADRLRPGGQGLNCMSMTLLQPDGDIKDEITVDLCPACARSLVDWMAEPRRAAEAAKAASKA